MSRRISFFVLAATAALIATQASADPECFGESCRLLEAGEPPAAAAPLLDADNATAPETHLAAPEASAAAAKPAPAKALPQMAADPVMRAPVPPMPSLAEEASTPREPVRLTPAKPLPRMAADPVVRAPAPPMPSLADETSALREPARLAPRYPKDAPPPPAPVRVTNPPPADHVRSARVSSPEPNYVVGQNLVGVGGIVTIVPGAVYTTRYLIAPSAKIISIDTDD